METAKAIEAIEKRISVRAYEDRPIEQGVFDQLEAYIAKLNAESGLHFQLYGPRGEGQDAITMSATMFSGRVHCYAALPAPDDPISGEKVGYYGEKLVLYATSLDLGSCWVASTYDKDTTRVEVAPGERVWDVVPLGYIPQKTPLKQRTIRSTFRARNKKPEQFVQSAMPYDKLPAWFRRAIDLVRMGPSAINGQPVVFTYGEDESVSASLPKVERPVQYNDLGIAKLHFQIAAASHGVQGTWEWGSGGSFVRIEG